MTLRGHRVLAWLAAMVLACLFAARPAAAQQPPVVFLDAARPSLDAPAWGWLGPAGAGGIDAVAGNRLPMEPLAAGAAQRLAPGKVLWARLRLQATRGQTAVWQLEVPVPLLDQVTVYQRNAAGTWERQSAGDTVPARAWPQPGRYPVFQLQLPAGGPHDVVLEFHHATPIALPMRLVTTARHDERNQLEYLGLGIVWGALALLVLATLWRAWALRDGAYGWFALYGVLAALAVAAFSGVGGYLLWPDTGFWVDAAPGCLAFLAGTALMLIVAKLSGAVVRKPLLGYALQLAGAAGLALAVAYVFVDRISGMMAIGGYMLVVAGLALYAAALTWRRGDPVGRWMLLGALPLALSVVTAVARVFGWIEAFWLTEYALVLALTIDLPMMLGALNSRSRERRGAELRQLASASQDPLTGLMKAKPFQSKLSQAVYRFQRRGEGAGVAVIEVTNYEWIKKTRGAEAAEECLLRTVIKLRRLVRDVDTTGRIGENRFGLILEGVSIHKALNGVAQRLVASGLMEEPGRPKDVPLQFHIAGVLLKDYAVGATEILEALSGVLEGMSPRTHRPFRYFDPAEAHHPPAMPAPQEAHRMDTGAVH